MVKEEKKNLEKIRYRLDEEHEFIAETPFDFPGRNLFEKSRSRTWNTPPELNRRPLTHKYE